METYKWGDLNSPTFQKRNEKKMQISRWLVIVLSVAGMAAMAVLLALPKEWVGYVIIGGMVLFIGFFMAFNVLLILVKERHRRKKDNDSDRSDTDK